MPISPETTTPAPTHKPRRWRKRQLLLLLVLFLAGIALALLLWPRPEMASEHFMEGYYGSDLFGVGYYDSEPLFSLGIYETHEFHGGDCETSFYDGEHGSVHINRRTYKIDGSTVRIANSGGQPDTILHYRTFDGVAVLLTPEGLAIYEQNGGLLPEHQNDSDLREKILVRNDPRRYADRARLVREHPRFAAALPPEVRAGAEIPWTLYLRYRWHDYLTDHPGLRERLPAQLHGP
jgi:hypothetical protein